MYILKNAFISITRNKGRNILIGAIILVVACACTVTLAINNTASDLINSYESAYDKELTISFNREKMMEDVDFSNRDKLNDMQEKFSDIESYTVEDVKNYANSEHIESYYYTYSISLNGNNIEKAEMETSDDSSSGKMNFPGGRENSMGMNMSSMDFTLSGYSSIESMSEFIEGTYEMTEITDDAWDLAFDGNYVFINEELAEYNSLSLNDTIKLEDEDGNTYKFEIIGIYTENSSDDSSFMSMFSNSANTIVTNADALASITDSNSEVTGSLNATFIIDDYANKDVIQDEFYEKGLDENYSVQTNEEVANSGLSSVQNVKSFATTFLIITLLIGGIVLFIINMINIRERKYEIGVLRTIGISKLKLTFQFVAELLMVALVALLLGAGLGATMSKGISNSLLASEIESSQETVSNMKNNFGGGPSDKGGAPDRENSFDKISGVPTIQAYDSIDAVVNISVVGQLLGLGIILVLISSVAAMVSIQRFSPLTILKERS